jgi:anti-sigma factor RsiW
MMTNDPNLNRLRELSWRRKLTPAEAAELRAWLAAHPEASADIETEAGLTDMLGRLPDVPVASNFTARVLQAVEGEAASESRARSRRRGWWRGFGWLPRVAVVAAVAGVALISYREVETSRCRGMARSVEAVAEVSSLPSPKILEDFDAIRAMSPAPGADEELLALFK